MNKYAQIYIEEYNRNLIEPFNKEAFIKPLLGYAAKGVGKIIANEAKLIGQEAVHLGSSLLRHSGSGINSAIGSLRNGAASVLSGITKPFVGSTQQGSGLAIGNYKAMIAARRSAEDAAKKYGRKFIDFGPTGEAGAIYSPTNNLININPSNMGRQLRGTKAHELMHFYQNTTPVNGFMKMIHNNGVNRADYINPKWQNKVGIVTKVKEGLANMGAEVQARVREDKAGWISAISNMQRNSKFYADYYKKSRPVTSGVYTGLEYAPTAITAAGLGTGALGIAGAMDEQS